MTIINKSPMGVSIANRQPVAGPKRQTGWLEEKVVYNDLNQLMFELKCDHIIGTSAQVTALQATTYYDSTSTSFLDINTSTVTFANGDKIAWRGLDTLTASIDISTIDDLEHIMWQGVTIAFGAYSLSLGDNQRGELKYSGGPVTAKSGRVQLIDTGRIYEEFKTEDLIINVQSNTTVDADAKSISFFNVETVPTRIYDVDETFDITTDLMSGTSEYNSTWYQMWIDSEGTRLLVPDFESTTTGTTSSKLVDSGATFQTDLVQIGDIVYNLTDLTKTTVTAIDSETQLSVADDIFTSGENYKIRILTPTGLGEYKARIGAAYNNSSGNLDDSYYTQIQEEKTYIGGGGGGADFSISSTPAINTLRRARISVKQVNDWTGTGSWKIGGNITYSITLGSSTGVTLTINGITFQADTSFRQKVSGGTDAPMNTLTCFAVNNTNTISMQHASISTSLYMFTLDYLELDKKPTFHN